MSPIDPRSLAERSRAASFETARQGRASLRVRAERLRAGGWPIVQTALAAGLAWALATAVLGEEQPAFAPIAAVISLGITLGQRGRRAVELAGGVVVGITIADAIVSLLGGGPLQIALIVALAMSAALLVSGGGLLVTEAGVSATLIAVLEPAGGDGVSIERVVEALLGGGVALVMNYLFFPIRPELLVGRAASRVFGSLGTTLGDIARALDDGDPDLAERTLDRARAIDPEMDALAEAIATGQETARLAPGRWRAGGLLQLYAEAASQLDLAVRNTRVLARAVRRLVDGREAAPWELTEAVRELADAVWSLAAQLDEPERDYPTRELALRAGARATALLEERGDLAVSVVVGQIRSTAIDLLRASGMDAASAAAALEEHPCPERARRGAQAFSP